MASFSDCTAFDDLNTRLRNGTASVEEVRQRMRQLFKQNEQLMTGILKQHSQEIRILVEGKTGNGKSTLVNALIGEVLAEESQHVSREGETTELKHYSCEKNGIKMVVYDSPGFSGVGSVPDSDARKSIDFDLSVFCIKMLETRFTPDCADVIAMKRLTLTYGENCWKRTVIALTFANAADAVNIDMKLADKSQKNCLFRKQFKDWEDVIRRTMVDVLHISQAIADDVLIVATGHYKIPTLFDQDHWQSELWLHCLIATSIHSLDIATAL